MLKNANLLAKIAADTAENEQQSAEILPIGRRVAARDAAAKVRARGAAQKARCRWQVHPAEARRGDHRQRRGSGVPAEVGHQRGVLFASEFPVI